MSKTLSEISLDIQRENEALRRDMIMKRWRQGERRAYRIHDLAESLICSVAEVVKWVKKG